MSWKGSATVGIDVGTNDSIIAYVGKAMVDIVQNEVSQRKTATVVGFNDRERLMGDSAAVVVKSNYKNSVRNFRHLMGPKDMCAESITREDFWQLCKTCDSEDGSIGFEVNYKGEQRIFSATQIMGMYLTKMKETAEGWCKQKVMDCVLSVPSYFNDFQRQAMLEAASIAGLNCLRLMNEHTATALAYGIYRTKEFTDEKPTIVAFGHMGHSNFSISIVSFTAGKLNILAEASSQQCAGRSMDECIMRHFAAEFQKKYGCDPLTNKKALLKLEDACSKCKKVLSANDQSPINVECLMEEEDLSGKMSRDDFIGYCEPLIKICGETVDKCIKDSGLENVMNDVDFVEIVGGASRVPWFQKVLQEKFGKEMSRTLNADECIARGCALQAAILSPAFKVRDFKVDDKVPHSLTITWMGSNKDAVEADAADADKDDAMDGADAAAAPAEPQKKSMEVFNCEKDKMDTKRYITWFRQGPFDLGAQYSDSGIKVGDYKIQLSEQPEKRKIKIEARMSLHGIFSVENAHIVETEEYEEVTKEKREIKDDGEDEPMPDVNAPAANGDSADAAKESKPAEEGAPTEEKPKEEKKEEKKPKYEWVEVKKPKKRTKRTHLQVTPVGKPGMPSDMLQKFKDIESALVTDTREAKENDDRRNELETYIYSMREKVTGDGGSHSEYMQKPERESFATTLMGAEDWLYDHFEATTVELCDKLGELQLIGGPVLKRYADRQVVEDYIPNFQNILKEVRTHANNPSEDFAHIDQGKKQNMINAADQLEEWILEQQTVQKSKPLHEEAPVKVADFKVKEEEIIKLCRQVMSEPKPAPPPEPVKAENKEGEHQADNQESTEKMDVDKEKPATEAEADEAAADKETAASAETTEAEMVVD